MEILSRLCKNVGGIDEEGNGLPSEKILGEGYGHSWLFQLEVLE